MCGPEKPFYRNRGGFTAFLERFFPRYVAYDFTAGMEDELDDVSGGRADWKALLEAFWKDFKPKSDEVMERKPSEVTEALDEFLSDYLFPATEDGSIRAAVPSARPGGFRCAAGGTARSWPARIIRSARPAKFAQGGASADAAEDGELGQHPETGEPILRRAGRFGPTPSRWARARRRSARESPRTSGA